MPTKERGDNINVAKNIKTYVLKTMLKDTTLSDEAFGVLVVLQPFSSCEQTLISTQYINYLLTERELSKVEKNSLKAGLQELIEKGYVKVIKELDSLSMQMVCDLTPLYIPNNGVDYFVVIDMEEVQRIMSITTKTNKFKLLRYYISIISHFNYSKKINEKYRGKICSIALEDINCSVPAITAIRYNEILEEKELLYIFRSEELIVSNKNGKVTGSYNIYSRFSDEALCKEYALSHSTIGKKIDIDKANQQRGLAQKYIAFCKGKKYSIETIKEIYIYCLEWNELQQQKVKEDTMPGHKPRKAAIKDLSVFDEYLYDLI